jgi:hypothetical protein
MVGGDDAMVVLRIDGILLVCVSCLACEIHLELIILLYLCLYLCACNSLYWWTELMVKYVL